LPWFKGKNGKPGNEKESKGVGREKILHNNSEVKDGFIKICSVQSAVYDKIFVRGLPFFQ
jgi:hypothetical protein